MAKTERKPKQKTNLVLLGAVFLAGLILGAVLLVLWINTPREIGSCGYTINSPGKYFLAKDITVNPEQKKCIFVEENVNNIEIDCQGHSITGEPKFQVENYTHAGMSEGYDSLLRVRLDSGITEYAPNGIVVPGNTGIRIHDCKFETLGWAVDISYSSDVVFSSNEINNVLAGYGSTQSSKESIINNIMNNTRWPIDVGGFNVPTDTHIIKNNRIYGSIGTAINTKDSWEDLVADNYISTFSTGIHAENSGKSVFRNNTVIGLIREANEEEGEVPVIRGLDLSGTGNIIVSNYMNVNYSGIQVGGGEIHREMDVFDAEYNKTFSELVWFNFGHNIVVNNNITGIIVNNTSFVGDGTCVSQSYSPRGIYTILSENYCEKIDGS